ncbi:MAG TPA: hypothetical protein VIU61_05940, partial [Kofleriaceae bacterium]
RAVIIVVGVLVGLLGTASADRKKAMQLNAQGMKLYQKKAYGSALELFEKAIKEDETLAYAHYNLASMASLTSDFEIAIRELEWCKKSTDPVAAKLLAKAKTDKDLENALMHPRVRELAGVPALDTLTIDQVLLERSGVWGSEASACGAATIAITFKKGGKFTAKSVWACNESYDKTTATGTWSVKDKVVTLVPKKTKGWENKLTGTIGPCDDRDEKYGKCLVLDEDGQQTTLGRGDQTF